MPLFESDRYSVADYGVMISPSPRVAAYVKALRAVISKDAVVMDLGAGVGLFALLAADLRARRVFAAEPDDVIGTAREIAAANGQGRIEFFQEISLGLELPERADVIVSDLRGVLPLYRLHIPTIVDARTRLLAAGGTLIPGKDTIWAAPVEDAKTFERLVHPWTSNPHGYDFSPALRVTLNAWRRRYLPSSALLASPRHWATIDYERIEDPNMGGEMTWTADRHGTLHGFSVWFDADLGFSATYTNAPGAPELVYGQAFFPVERATPIESGDAISLSLEASLVGGDYIWRWESSIIGGDKCEKATFRQSSFHGVPLSRSTVERVSADHVPTLTDEGQAAREALERMNEGVSLEEIAESLTSRFPEVLGSRVEALDFVSSLSRRWAR